MYNESELVSLLREKNKKAFDHLYEKYSGNLYMVISRITRNEHLAQDALQDAFIKIWNNFESYTHERGRLYTWMINVARNCAIDIIRRKEEVMSCKVYDYNSVQDLQHCAGTIEQKPDRIGLDKLVAKLKPDHQALIQLVYYKGYTMAQVSDMLDIPLGTIKTRLRSSMKNLRSNFAYQSVPELA